jgi:hypothetical protein
MEKYSKISIKVNDLSIFHNFDKSSWESFLNDNKITYMEYQRSVDHNHVEEIVKYLKSYENGDASFISPIVLGKLDNKYYIIDGQHRINALKNFSDNYSLMVNLIFLKDHSDLNYKLKLVNSNKPYIQIETNHIKNIEEFLLTTYKEYIKKSEKPLCPHININNIVKKLNNYTEITFNTFLQKFEELEVFLKENYKCLGISTTDFKKCFKNNTNPFYCGSMKNNTWLDAIIIAVESNSNISSIDFSKYPFTKKRTKIPITHRKKLWETQSNNLNSTCYICENSISFHTFECGHIIPVFKGGNNSIENMKCICRDCNRDCGIMNLDKYKLLVNNYN